MNAEQTEDAAERFCVCWLSSGRYSQPLDSANARKWQLLAALPGLDIRVIGFAAGLRPRRFREQVDFLLLPKVPLALLRHLTYFALAPWLLLLLVARGQADIIVAQSPFEGAIGAFVKRLPWRARRPRLIVENHNNFEDDLFLQRRVPFKRLYGALMRACARYAFRHADALRVISSSTAQQAARYAPELPQVRFMTFSDTEVFRKARRRVPVKQAVDLVYVGVLIPRKGLHHLLNAFAKLDHPRATLHLVGRFENMSYFEQLAEQVADLDLAWRVRFAGAASQRELAEILGRSRAMVLPSLSEGLGRVVIEAMLMGMPVIGSRVGGIPDMIEEGVTGLLVEPGNEDDLLRALQQICKPGASEMGKRARHFALDFFSPQQYRDGYQELFDIVLNRRGETGRAKPPAVPSPGREGSTK